MEDQIPQVLIPTERIYQIRRGKPVQRERNILPGYILVNTALNGEIMHFIKGITNVIGFVSNEKGKIDPLRDDEVIRILGKVDEISENDEVVIAPFLVGEHVKIIDGPFKGMSGFIEEL
jgi:transcriptional antiterminator NusG